MAEKRLYVVMDGEKQESRLVMAISSAAALRHVVSPRYIVQTASAHDVAVIMGGGGKVETAVNESEALPLDPTGTTAEALRHSDAVGNKVKVPK